MRRALVLGASGSLGQQMVRALAGSGVVVTATSLQGGDRIQVLDARRGQRVLETARRTQPDWIVHAIAQTDVEACERLPGEAWRTNVQTAINAATAADETGARLVLMSTNAVFDGRRSLYKEEDEPHPVNVYGQTKLEAEAAALQGGGLVIRASTLAWTGRSKVPFINYAVNELRAGRRVQAYVDIWDSPVHTSTLAEAMSHLMLADSSGIFHVASERLTRYETTRRVAERFGLRAGLVEEARYQFSGSSVRRPPDTSLEAKKLLRTLGIVTPMRDQIERLVTEAATAVASV